VPALAARVDFPASFLSHDPLERIENPFQASFRASGAQDQLARMIGVPRGIRHRDVSAEGRAHHDRLLDLERNAEVPAIYDIEFRQPMQGWKTAWRRALEGANVKARWHDLRHSLVSRLAEQPTVSEETIRALAGHVSRQMPSRYAHIRASAKRAAITSLETGGEGITKRGHPTNLDTGSPQKSPQFVEGEEIVLERPGPKLLN
jgi:Phage integrase family